MLIRVRSEKGTRRIELGGSSADEEEKDEEVKGTEKAHEKKEPTLEDLLVAIAKDLELNVQDISLTKGICLCRPNLLTSSL